MKLDKKNSFVTRCLDIAMLESGLLERAPVSAVVC